MTRQTLEMLNRLQRAGISLDDALKLRRIAMTLHRWFELECGDSNNYGSWCIVRGRWDKVPQPHGVSTKDFVHDDDGTPFMERHVYDSMVTGRIYYDPIPDREKGARKRLAAILARYPGFQAYVQTDPRGCPLWILRPGDLPTGQDVSCAYTRGLPVHA